MPGEQVRQVRILYHVTGAITFVNEVNSLDRGAYLHGPLGHDVDHGVT